MSTATTRNVIAILIVTGALLYSILYPDKFTFKDVITQLISFLSGWLLMERPRMMTMEKKDG